MEYSRRRIDKNDELNLLTGLIISPEFVKQVSPLYRKDYLTLPYTKTVAEWAIQYYNKYDKAIGSDIMAVFDTEKSKIRDQAVVESIETFLLNLNDKYEQTENFNVQYQADNAIRFFKTQALSLHIDKVKVAMMTGNIEQAEAEVSNFKRIEKGSGSATSVWCDTEEAMKAVRDEDEGEVIVKFPGELGQVIRPFTTDDYVAFIAPAKRKKTWWLIETAILASLNKKNVLFVTLEMPAKQLRKRIYQRISGSVVSNYSNETGFCEVDIPYFASNFGNNESVSKRKENRPCLSARAILKKMRSIHELIKSDNFRILEYPANTLTPSGLERELDNLEYYDDWIPQAIIFDYGDIAGTERKGEFRQEINEKWLGLRRIHQDRKLLMVTASHTRRESINRDVREEDVVEDIRKLSHLTACIGINETDNDRVMGIQRLSMLADRFMPFNPAKEAVVTQCLDFGAIYLDSRMRYKESKG